MKFNHSLKKFSKHRGKKSKKKFFSSFLKNFSWYKKKDASRLPPRIEELENEFMSLLEKINERNAKDSEERVNEECQRKFYANERLLITRSIDDFARFSRRRYLHSSFSSPFVHRAVLKSSTRQSNQSDLSLTNIPKYRTKEIADSSLKTSTESIGNTSTLSSNRSDISKYSQSHDAAIIDFEHQSLGKSSSSPLPMNTNHSSIIDNPLQSAHLINSCFYENKNAVSLQSCCSEMGMDHSMEETSSSDEENGKRSLLKHDKDYLRNRWSLMDMWESAKMRLPSVLNHVWRKNLRQTGSKEYLLEYDQTLATNNNHQANSIEEQRYIEQERSIHAHIGLALFALLVFPPIGMIAFLLSIWSLCGQQDRHLSRKFGNAVYWISLLAIGLAFLLLFTLFLYFTYRYLTHPWMPNSVYTNNKSSERV